MLTLYFFNFFFTKHDLFFNQPNLNAEYSICLHPHTSLILQSLTKASIKSKSSSSQHLKRWQWNLHSYYCIAANYCTKRNEKKMLNALKSLLSHAKSNTYIHPLTYKHFFLKTTTKKHLLKCLYTSTGIYCSSYKRWVTKMNTPTVISLHQSLKPEFQIPHLNMSFLVLDLHTSQTSESSPWRNNTQRPEFLSMEQETFTL